MDTIDDFTGEKGGKSEKGVDDHEQYVFDDEITDYIGLDDLTDYKGLLYKYNEADGGGKRRVQVYKYYNTIPDSHEVGVLFGGGRYLLWLSGIKDGKRFSRSFNLKLGKNYDDLMVAAKRDKNVSAIVGGGASASGSGSHGPVDVMQVMNFALTLVEKISGSIPKQSTAPQLPEAVLTNLYQHMQRLMFSQARDTQRMIQELRKDDDTIEYEPAVAVNPADNDFAIKIIELIKSVLPTLLNPLIGSGVVSAAKKTEEFRRIKDNPDLQREVIEGLKREVGPENTEKIKRSFGLDRQKRSKK